jgi:hypothetical protein
LEPQVAALRDSLRPENRQLFEKYCTRTQGGKRTWYEDMLARREFMKAQGYGCFFSSYRVLTILSTPVNRPLPRDAQLLVARREAGVRTVQDLRALGHIAIGGDRSVASFLPIQILHFQFQDSVKCPTLNSQVCTKTRNFSIPHDLGLWSTRRQISRS